MTYCHTCSSIIKGYLVWGKPHIHWKQHCWWQQLANLVMTWVHNKENTLLFTKTLHRPELQPLPAFRRAAFASLTQLLPQALQTCTWDLRDLMFLFNHSPNTLLHPDNRTSFNCLSPGCWQLLIAMTLTGAGQVSKAEFLNALHPELRPAW